MVPFKLNYTVDSVQGIISFTMDVDMLAHFDGWQRSGKDDDCEAQDQWPVELRRARVFPAVDYLQVCCLLPDWLLLTRSFSFTIGMLIDSHKFVLKSWIYIVMHFGQTL